MNLIITCPRHFEPETTDEITKILNSMGDDSPTVQSSYLPGIIMINSTADPVAVTSHIRTMIHDEPWTIRYIQRAIPIQSWIPTDLEGIVSESQRLAGQILGGEKYRITITKRDSNISSREIISKVAHLVDRDVSLDTPDKIILVEIFGKFTGLSVMYDSDIVSVEREKRLMSE